MRRIPADHENNTAAFTLLASCRFFFPSQPSCGLLPVSRPINPVCGAPPLVLLRLPVTGANEDSIICSPPPPLLRRLRDETSSWPLTTKDPLQRRFTCCRDVPSSTSITSTLSAINNNADKLTPNRGWFFLVFFG